MRPYARLRVGRIVALGVGVWLRRSLQIHAVTALCLAPLVLFSSPPDPFDDGTIVGLFGLYATAWGAAVEISGGPGIFRNLTVAYLAQFAVTVILVRDAHRRLAGRAPRCGLLAILGLAFLAILGLAVFAVLDSVVAAGFASDTALPALLAIAVTVAEAFLGATFWLALPAAAVDGHGAFAALGRARLLAHGSRFPVAVLIILLVFLQWVMMIPLGFLAGSLDTQWLFAVPAFLFLTLKACVLAAAHHEACFRKEGAGTEDLTAVFA